MEYLVLAVVCTFVGLIAGTYTTAWLLREDSLEVTSKSVKSAVAQLSVIREGIAGNSLAYEDLTKAVRSLHARLHHAETVVLISKTGDCDNAENRQLKQA